MRIAVVTPGRSHLLNMAKEHIHNGHDVVFYTMVSKRRCLKFGLPKENIVSFFIICAPLMFIFRKIHLPYDWNRYIYYLVVRIVDFLAAIRLRECDIFIGISGCALLSAKKAINKYNALFLCDRGCKHILAQNTILNNTPNSKRVFSKDIPIELEQYAMANYIILPSLHSRESFIEQGIIEKKLFVNPYGVNLSWFFPTKLDYEKAFDVIIVGIWTLRKGVDLLVNACENKKLSLLHVGPLSSDYPFPNNVNFRHIDSVDEKLLSYYYSMAKVFCLPSREDGFGLVLFQAMACGLPLVYSHDTGGPDLKKLVDDHDFLFEMPEYTVDSLSDTLLRALKKAEQQPRNCVRSYLTPNAVSNISWQAYGQRYNEFLLKVAAGK